MIVETLPLSTGSLRLPDNSWEMFALKPASQLFHLPGMCLPAPYLSSSFPASKSHPHGVLSKRRLTNYVPNLFLQFSQLCYHFFFLRHKKPLCFKMYVTIYCFLLLQCSPNERKSENLICIIYHCSLRAKLRTWRRARLVRSAANIALKCILFAVSLSLSKPKLLLSLLKTNVKAFQLAVLYQLSPILSQHSSME